MYDEENKSSQLQNQLKEIQIVLKHNKNQRNHNRANVHLKNEIFHSFSIIILGAGAELGAAFLLRHRHRHLEPKKMRHQPAPAPAPQHCPRVKIYSSQTCSTM